MAIVIKVTQKDRSSLAALGAYRLVYWKNSLVKAPEGSLGCMCFETVAIARKFISYNFFSYRETCKYLRIEGFGEPQFPTRISLNATESSLHVFYHEVDVLNAMPPPKGTICYPEVLVLD